MHFRFLLLLLWLTIGHAWTPPLSEPLGRRAILGRLTAGAVTWFALDDPLRAVAQAPLADLPAQVVEPAAEGMSQTFQDKTIGEIEASGIIFKDILKVDRVGDPKVSGVQLYVSEFRRPITERLLSTGGTDLFSDPALAAVSCLKTGATATPPSVAVPWQYHMHQTHRRVDLMARCCFRACDSGPDSRRELSGGGGLLPVSLSDVQVDQGTTPIRQGGGVRPQQTPCALKPDRANTTNMSGYPKDGLLPGPNIHPAYCMCHAYAPTARGRSSTCPTARVSIRARMRTSHGSRHRSAQLRPMTNMMRPTRPTRSLNTRAALWSLSPCRIASRF
jgi:hypothetical protein